MTPEFYNRSFYEQFEIDIDNCTLDDFVTLVHPDDQSLFENNVSEHQNGKETFRSTYRMINKFGDVVWIEAFAMSSYDEDGNFIDMVGVHTDITDKKKIEDHVYQVAYRDELTGLYNRKKLMEDLSECLKSDKEFSILQFRLKSYSKLLASYGFPKLNQIIKEISNVSLKMLQDDMRLYRISSNDFLVITENKYSNDVPKKYMNIFELWLKRASKKLELDSPLKVYASFMSLTDEVDINSADDVVYVHNLMLDEASRINSDEIMIYEHGIQEKLVRQLFLERNILNGVKNEEFYLHYQPIVSLDRLSIVGFEALVRWNNERYGSIYPNDFIPVAENNRTIIQLGEYILYKSMSFIKEYNQKNGTDLHVSVNLSVVQLLQDDFVKKVIRIIALLDFDSSKLKFEITESTLIEDPEKIIRQINRLKEIGIRFSLDDFGTGYASMNNLFNLPIDEVKIDRSLMLNAVDDRTICEFLYSLSQLCHRNDIKVVSEGIEDLDMISRSKKITADYLQGYFFSKPLSVEDALNLDIEKMFLK
jgi:EAL domain-containing protein (putative c-di-GMP-specific phosphodiesterase class I)/GGDEF domain-containing protein